MRLCAGDEDGGEKVGWDAAAVVVVVVAGSLSAMENEFKDIEQLRDGKKKRRGTNKERRDPGEVSRMRDEGGERVSDFYY